MSAWRGFADESARYLAASALALAIDLGTYSGLIRLAGVNYLVAAPAGFALGLAAIYLLSVRWVFRQRRLKDQRAEFALFIALSLVGMALNQLMIYVGVQLLGLAYELAKFPSAAVVFCFNFASRKLLLFTRFR
ncbi:MAG TPA: GtrA family protein [Burkholderiales bacterium]|nr:GtrA family protein [Burkholderiales bacterium]